MQKKMSTNRKGLTFVETIMAVSILSIIILASTAVSATYLRGRISIKKYQANNEELSVALNYLAKDIRMSSLIDPPPDSAVRYIDSITIENNDGGALVTYEFVDSGLQKELRRDGVPIIKNVTGSFYTKVNNIIPRITIIIKKEGLPGMLVQTTVSLRTNYEDQL